MAFNPLNPGGNGVPRCKSDPQSPRSWCRPGPRALGAPETPGIVQGLAGPAGASDRGAAGTLAPGSPGGRGNRSRLCPAPASRSLGSPEQRLSGRQRTLSSVWVQVSPPLLT